MKDGLSIKFNHKAPKEIKTEAGIKTGVRSDGYGGTMVVRAGKILSHSKAQETKLNEYRHAAAEATAKKHQAAQEHHKPAHVQTRSL